MKHGRPSDGAALVSMTLIVIALVGSGVVVIGLELCSLAAWYWHALFG